LAKILLNLFFIFLILIGTAQPGNTCPREQSCPNWFADKYAHACLALATEQSCCCAARQYSPSLQTYGCECSQKPANDQANSYYPLISSKNTEQAMQSIAESLTSVVSFFEQSITFPKLANSKIKPGKLYLLYRALLI
jgi:hypothetical protein